jgi:hypothetical protein
MLPTRRRARAAAPGSCDCGKSQAYSTTTSSAAMVRRRARTRDGRHTATSASRGPVAARPAAGVASCWPRQAVAAPRQRDGRQARRRGGPHPRRVCACAARAAPASPPRPAPARPRPHRGACGRQQRVGALGSGAARRCARSGHAGSGSLGAGAAHAARSCCDVRCARALRAATQERAARREAGCAGAARGTLHEARRLRPLARGSTAPPPRR